MSEAPDREKLSAEVVDVLERYTRAFEQGDLDGVTGFMHFPMAYIGDDAVKTLDRYPFDPARLKEKTGLARSDANFRVIAIDEHKAHVNITATRYRADDTPIESVDAIYILLCIDGDWKIAVMSGVRVPAA